jgi:hypothetical protein
MPKFHPQAAHVNICGNVLAGSAVTLITGPDLLGGAVPKSAMRDGSREFSGAKPSRPPIRTLIR